MPQSEISQNSNYTIVFSSSPPLKHSKLKSYVFLQLIDYFRVLMGVYKLLASVTRQTPLNESVYLQL